MLYDDKESLLSSPRNKSNNGFFGNVFRRRNELNEKSLADYMKKSTIIESDDKKKTTFYYVKIWNEILQTGVCL